MTAPPLPELRTPALVLADGTLPEVDGATVVELGATVPEPPADGWASVAVVVADETALRRAVSVLPPLGRSRSVSVVLRSAVAPVSLTLRPEWPPLRELDARLDAEGVATTTLTFVAAPAVTDVLLELARACGLPASTGGGGLVGAGVAGTPVDPLSTNDDVPPTVVLPGTVPPETTVTAQPPMTLPDDVGEPLDEALLNPAGFERAWTRPVVDLDPAAQPTPAQPTAALVASLRDAAGVRLPPSAPPRLVAGLAMAGVPLVDSSSTVDLDDALARAEHSIAQRRAAFDQHSTFAWRRRVASRAGVRAAAYPSVTVVLTAAPDRLDHAREQLARQRGVELTVVPPGDPVAGDVVLPTDADGWWGPEVVLDLLRARRWSGAGVVEMPVEVAYDGQADVTVLVDVPTELSVDHLLPGSLVLVDRPLLSLVGAPGLASRAGATTYRTHGLGWVARLSTPLPAPPSDVAQQWSGLRLGPLVEADVIRRKHPLARGV